jgi:imidazolonepropionase-like amidohydrolase
VNFETHFSKITEIGDAEDCYFTNEETPACVYEAHKHGIKLCAHARARDSVRQCLNHGVEVIYHASCIDAECNDILSLLAHYRWLAQNNSNGYPRKEKTQHVVVPAINWLVATLYEAGAFGYATEVAEKAGYKKEPDTVIVGLREMRRRGIVELPGG